MLSSLTLAACAGYGALVLGTASWADTQQLDAIFPFYSWRIRQFSAAELRQAGQALALLAGACGLAAAWLSQGVGRAEWRATVQEVRRAGTGLWSILQRLPARQRRLAGFTLLGLTVLRSVLSLPGVTPEYDDVASYELFASKSWLAVASYYPIPNNHVLANTVSWVFCHVHPGFWFTMRLPVLLAATAATVLGFAGLLWIRASFRAAWLATVLYSLSGLSLYHAAVGRGYSLLAALAGVVFFSTLALTTARRPARAGWVGLLGGAVLGLYTVPTFALVLVSAGGWVAMRALRQRALRVLLAVAGMGAVAGAGSLLLYAPLLFVSGPASLFANGFVRAHSRAAFWNGLPAYLWHTEGSLAGQMTVGALLTLLGLGATVVRLRRRPRPADRHAAADGMVLTQAALWFVLAPYVALALLHVLAPERTLLYKSFFFFVLLGLAADDLLRAAKWTRPPWARALLLGAAAGWAGYQVASLWRDSRPLHHRNQALHAAYQWLAGRPAGALLVPEPTHALFLRMYLHTERPGKHWRLDAFPQPGVAYRYVLAFPQRRGYFQPRFSGSPVFHNDQVDVYQPTPAQADPADGLPPYWHLTR